MSEANINSLWEDLLCDDKFTVAHAASELSSYYLGQDEFVLTEELSKKAISIFESEKFIIDCELYQCYVNYAISLSEQDKATESLNVISYALTISHYTSNSFYTELMFIKAHLHSYLGEFDEALKTYEELLLISDLNDDILKSNSIYLCIAEIHIKTKNAKKVKEILELYNQTYDEVNNLENVLSYIKFKAQVYLWEQNTNEAKYLYQEALELAQALNSNFEIAYLLYLIASCDYELQNYRNSEIYAILARDTLITNDLKNKDALVEIKNLLDKLNKRKNLFHLLFSKVFFCK